MVTHGAVVAAFVERFGAAPSIVARAPGRVNVIGEHTDYNDGFVLPAAIDRATWVACRPRGDRRVVLHAPDVRDEATLSLDAIASTGRGRWVDYATGVLWAMREAGHAIEHGFDAVVTSDVPRGAGLSSSAALELALARAVVALHGGAWEPAAMARVAQRAENAWVGVRCGIMDQMASAASRAGHALLIDCRTLATRDVALPDGVSLLVLDSATRRGLVGSAYNDRREQCEEAARALGVGALRDVAIDELERRWSSLDPVVARRARHVVTENDRTVRCAEALARGDVRTAGRLMDASHASMRDDFEISRRELDVIVETTRAEAGCFGARMTGGGFGGCAVALVETGAAPSIATAVVASYRAATGLDAAVYVCTATDGASLVDGRDQAA